MQRRRARPALSLAAILLAEVLYLGCDSPRPITDAGPDGNRLAIVGDADVGLAPGEQRPLRVRYGDSSGRTLPGARIEFAIFGDPRGSTLSADTATTDESGEAAVLMRAGAVSCRFEVRVQTPGTSVVRFYLEVSSAGFGSLAARSVYLGAATTPSKLSAVRYLLLSGLTCAGLDPGAPPAGIRERLSTSLDDIVLFKALPLDLDHSLLALASDATPQLRAWGCVEIPRGLPQPDRQLSLSLPLGDFQPRLRGRFVVGSDLSLPKPGIPGSRPLGDVLRPFLDLGDCPRDPAQLLLDCVVDALDDGDPLDCKVEAPSPFAIAVQTERGALDASGCRGPSGPAGGNSLDQVLRAVMEGNGKALLGELQELPSAALATLGTFQIGSLLEVLSTDAEGRTATASHRLQTVGFRRGSVAVELQVADLGPPAPLAQPVEIQISGWTARLVEHGFAFRWGTPARLALGKLHLAPAGLPESSPALVTALATLVSWNGVEGCLAIDAITCAAARLPAGCLSQACPAGLAALSSYLDSRFAASAVKATDFVWSGEADLLDDDGDLRVDRMGTHQKPGTWKARLMLGTEAVDVQATFQAKTQQQ